MIIHDFDESLKRSNEQTDAPWWKEVYLTAFPDLVSMVNVKKDGWSQRGGIDRVLILESGKTINVDEKVRFTTYDDILIEYFSDLEKRKKGWAFKDLATDYIAYAFVPNQTCYLIPFLSLRKTVKSNAKKWLDQFREKEKNKQKPRSWIVAYNKGYMTASIPVPIPQFFGELIDSMKVVWKAKESI